MTEEKKKQKVTYATEAAKRSGEFMRKIYRQGLEAAERGQPVAWCMARYAISEILQAMDVAPVYPENYGAATATMRKNLPYLEEAEAEGFDTFICSYFRTGMGLAHRMKVLGEMPPEAPLGGMAKPSILVLNTRGRLCDAAYKNLQAIGRYFDVPQYCLDMAWPASDVDFEEAERHYIKYMVEQFRDFGSFLEKLLGKKMNMDRFAEIVDTAEKTRRTWHECHELRKAVPCPMPSVDVWGCLVPEYYFPGEKESLQFYQELLGELQYKVANKIAAVPNEKYRTLFSEAAPWFDLEIFDWMASLGIVSVIEAHWYHPSLPVEIPPSITDPYERLARMFYEQHMGSNRRAKNEAFYYQSQHYLDFARDYQCDGAILMVLLTCRANSVHYVHSKNVLMEYAKVPSYVFDADLADPRIWPRADIMSGIESFVEVMESYKRIRQELGLPVAHPV